MYLKAYRDLVVSKLISKYSFFKKEFEWRNSSWIHSLLPEGIGLLNKNCGVRHDMPPYKLLVKESPETFETIQAIAIALGHPL